MPISSKQICKPIEGINLDINPNAIDVSQARFLKNVNIYLSQNQGSNSGTVGYQTPIISNDPNGFDPSILPSGLNTCIGTYYFKLLNQLVWFNYNASGNHNILIYDSNLNTFSVVQEATQFGFTLNNKIASANIVLLSGQNINLQRLLYWTDGNVYPAKINIDTALAGTYNTDPLYLPFADKTEFFNLAKYPPYLRPQIQSYGRDSSVSYNYLLYKLFQFCYRYIYDDGETSTYSPISTLAYVDVSDCLSSATALLADNYITLEMYTGSSIVVKIEILYRLNNGNAAAPTNPTDFYLYDTLNTSDIRAGGYNWNANPNIPNSFTYNFYNNRDYTFVDPTETEIEYSDVPLSAGALSFSNENILILGDIVEGYDNISESVLSNATFTATPQSNVNPETFSIIGYLVCMTPNGYISGGNTYYNQPIWQTTAPVQGEAPPPPFYFGGVNVATTSVLDDIGSVWQQNVLQWGAEPFTTGGFLVTLDGGDAVSFSSYTYQYISAGGANPQPWGVFPCPTTLQIENLCALITGGVIFLQYFEFTNIPVGKYVLRVASHLQEDLNRKGFLSSTYLKGYTNNFTFPLTNSTDKEFFIDGTGFSGGVYAFNAELGGFPVIWDLSIPDATPAKVFAGYLYDNENQNNPVELATVTFVDHSTGVATVETSTQTDGNGFFFALMISGSPEPTPSTPIDIMLNVYDNAGVATAVTLSWGYISSLDVGAATLGTVTPYFPTAFVTDTITTFYPDNQYIVKGQITTSGGQGIQGVPVGITRGAWTVTDGNGNWQLIVHADVTTSPRVDNIIYSQGYCIVEFDGSQVPALVPYSEVSPINTPAPIIIPTVTDADSIFANLRGLKSGGQYQFGIICYDAALRSTFVGNIPAFNLYIKSIPELYGTGDNLTPALIQWSVNNNFVLPVWVKYISICRTTNVNFQFDIQWLVNAVTPMFNNNTISPSIQAADNISLDISNLIAYNAAYNNSTSSTYQWTAGDRVRFIQNGNGEFYDAVNLPILDFSINSSDGASTIVIANSPALSSLVAGAWIEIYTPHAQEGNPNYYEVSNLIPCLPDNRNLNVPTQVTLTGNTPYYSLGAQTLDTFDTYWYLRSIIVTGIAGDTSGQPLNRFIPFESTNQSDFYDSEASDIGRINVVNEYALQQRKYSTVRYSNAYVQNTGINGLSTFDDADIMIYYQQYGAITKLYTIQNNLFVFQLTKGFRSLINQSLIYESSGGALQSNTSNYLSVPIEIKGNFGCTNPETFVEKDGIMIFVDAINSALVYCNGEQSIDASANGFKGYFIDKFQYIFNYNQSASVANQIYMSATIDPKNNDYILSFHSAAQSGDPFINDLYLPFDKLTNPVLNEGIKFNLANKNLKEFTAYTPEYLGMVDKGLAGQYFISFKNGSPYFHNLDSVTTYNTFYGVQTNQYVRVIFNGALILLRSRVINIPEPDTEKIFDHIQYTSDPMAYSVIQVLTSNPNQLSNIPINAMERQQNSWYSAIYNDVNTPTNITLNGLIDGYSMRGTYLDFLMQRDNTNGNIDKFNILNDIVIYFHPSPKTFSLQQ